MRKVTPDIIHAHFGFDGYRMVKPSLKNDIPFITSFYGSDVTRLPTEFDWPRRYRKLAKYGDAFIAISKNMKKQLIKLGFPESKIHIIPFGLDIQEFIFSNHSELNSLMMVGRMVEKKGFKYALRVIKFLKDQNISVHLDLFGNGPLEKQLKDLTYTWDLSKRVAFHGYTPIDQIKKEHNRHGMLLAPSITATDGDEEGLPNTILEAMASGTLVIASDHASIDEVIINNETGLLIPEGDAKAMAEAIKFALSNKSHIERMTRKARRFIENHHNIKHTIGQIETLYKSVITQ